MAYQIYKVRDPQGNIREIRGPAGASDDEVIAQAKRLLGEPAAAAPAAAAPSEIPGPRAEPSFMRQVGQGLVNVAAGAVRGAGSIGATLLTPLDYAQAALRRRAGEDVTGAQLSQERRAGITAGLQQLVGAEPESLAFRGGQLAGEIAGTAGVGGVLAAPLRTIPAAAPVTAALQSGGMAAGTPLALRAGAGAATGAAGAALVEPEAALSGALTGAGISAVAPPVLNVLGRAAGAVRDFRQSPNQLAAKIARESLDTPQQIAAARAALQAPEAQGLTAQQALAQGGVIAPGAQATLEKAISKTRAVDTRASIEAAQESARKSTLEAITPDLEKAVQARRAASKPLYEAADRAVVPIDQDLAGIFERMPQSIKAKAAEIAKMEGRPFIMGETAPAQIVETGMLDAAGRPITKEIPAKVAEMTGESMHYLRRALSDLAYGPPSATGAGRDAQLAARGLLDDYTRVFEAKVPAYAQARQVFSDLSAPVNQAQVLKEMVSVLEKPGGGERLGPFLNVLGRGETAMLKRAGGRGAPRYEAISEVLTPEQLAKVRDVAKQLETKAAVGQQITDGQQRASDLIKDELPNLRIPGFFSVIATTANKVLKNISNQVGRKTVEKLADAALTAKSFDELLATLPAAERSRVLKAISNPGTWAKTAPAVSGAAVGAAQSPTNALAPEAEPQNALAR